MTIQFAHSKTDREGQDAGNKRRVYRAGGSQLRRDQKQSCLAGI